MTANGWLQSALFFAVLVALMRPLGIYMARVLEGQKTFLDPEYCVPSNASSIAPAASTPPAKWSGSEYTFAMLLFSAVSLLLTYVVERAQHFLPWNPQDLAAVAPDLAWNTAASFTTNTNWQSYVPETTMSYLTQMLGLAYHNFGSAAVGIAVAMVIVRGIARKQSKTTRQLLGRYDALLPLDPAAHLPHLCAHPRLAGRHPEHEGLTPWRRRSKLPTQAQTIAQGPVASQEAIKMLGTNGGGFFNANSAHPFENPTPFSNFLQMLSIFLIPAALTVTLGRLTGSPGHGWAVFASHVGALSRRLPRRLLGGVATASAAAQRRAASAHRSLPAATWKARKSASASRQSALFATVTTDASCGAVNGMHDSFTPLGGMVVLTNIMLGEIIFGGVGAGMYGMLIFVVLAVFIAGLMVGRTPEYLGKKIEAYDVKMAMLYVLIFPLAHPRPDRHLRALSATGAQQPEQHWPSRPLRNSLRLHLGHRQQRLGLRRPQREHALVQPHRSASPCLIGRFLMMVPMLALAGNLAQKKSVPPSPGTFPVNTPLFTVLLVGVILIVGALTFFPALCLGPILEHLLAARRTTLLSQEKSQCIEKNTVSGMLQSCVRPRSMRSSSSIPAR